jgi:hypothetical protein
MDLSTDDASSYEMKTETILVNHAAGTKWKPPQSFYKCLQSEILLAYGLFEHCDLCAESQPSQAQLPICDGSECDETGIDEYRVDEIEDYGLSRDLRPVR